MTSTYPWRYLPDVLELVHAGVFDPAQVPRTVVPRDQADTAWLSPAIKLVVSRSAPA